jgi:N-acetylmuramic acid 6-phosphate etherase
MTEDVSQRFVDFDTWSTSDAVDAMYEGQLTALAAIRPSLRDIAAAVDAAAARIGDTGRLIYVGAGTSGRLAVQDGAELGPTFGWPDERTVFCIAGGMEALTISSEGAEDCLDDGVSLIEQANAGPHDIVFSVAASGKTPFTLGALREAKRRGALTIGIVNNSGAVIAEEADHAIVAETGSEILAGSTRMKAGTSQKVILNMISTAIMVRLGRVYKGYMVDMVASNAKLEQRAANMVSDISGCSLDEAQKALFLANKSIKEAILVAMGASLSESQSLLAENNGDLRTAIGRGVSPKMRGS